MIDSGQIFEVRTSVEEDRPNIAFDADINQGIDWRRVDLVLRGLRPATDYELVRLVVQERDATSWGYYSVPGTLGLISSEAIQRIGQEVFRRFQLFPAKLNDVDYVFLKCMEPLPCLDLAKSEVVPFPSNPQRIMEITKYVFKTDLISDPMLFSIPEVPGLLATKSVFEAISQSRIKGFRFIRLA
jgi:hypothetical protein